MYKNKLSYYFCCFFNKNKNKNKNTNNSNKKEIKEDTFNVLDENRLTEKLCRTPTSIDIDIKNKPYSLSNDMTITFADIYG